MLINLLSNAVKFTPENGQIILEASLIAKAISPQARESSYALRIAVVDTGIAIAPENLDQLFQPFRQIDSALNRKYQGTGLGLSLVKRIVELHGGEVGVESELGVGSCFTIDLPVEKTISSPIFESSATSSVTGSNSSVTPVSPLILLVADAESNITTTWNYLEAKGYRLVATQNGQEALQAVSHSQLPDLILIDPPMSRMDGLEAIQKIRSDDRLHRIPIIALTATAKTEDRDRCLQAGANAYLSKPIRMKQLVALIQQLLP